MENLQPKLTPVSELFKNLFKFLHEHFRNLLLINWLAFKGFFIPVLVFGLLFFVLALLRTGESMNYISVFIIIPTLILISFLIFCYFSIRAYITIFLFIKTGSTGEPKQLFRDSAKLFWSYIKLSLFVCIPIILLLGLYSVVTFYIESNFLSAFSLSLQFILLLVGLLVFLLHSITVGVFFFEDKRGLEAIRRGRYLLQGHFWQIFVRFLLLIILSSIIFSVVIVVPLLNILIALLFISTLAIFSCSLYSDLKKIKDVEPQIKQ